MVCPSSRSSHFFHRLAGIGVLVLTVFGGACTSAAPPPLPKSDVDPPAPHQLSADQPAFLRLPNTAADRTPVRIGLILPFKDRSANTRALADALLKASELALFDAANPDIVLMTADDAEPGSDAAKAAKKLLDQGAEVLIGPIFQASVPAVAAEARDRGVAVLAFSTDRTVAGKGVYLNSFQPQNEVERIVAYAVAHGHKKIAAMIPQTPYGDVVLQSFQAEAAKQGADIVALERYDPRAGAVNDQAARIAKSGCNAVFLPQSGSLLRAIVANLAYNGIDKDKVKYLGTGVWDDSSNAKEALLIGGWFAAPQPSADDAFKEKYRRTFHGEAPPLAALAYDAVLLVAHLAPAQPYRRFTRKALTDPAGFAGANGIFRFSADGAIDRGLAVLAVEDGGFAVVSPAPTVFAPPPDKPGKKR
jgi:branched-chain amino acid transport system substrate-binding protein